MQLIFHPSNCLNLTFYFADLHYSKLIVFKFTKAKDLIMSKLLGIMLGNS